jgi:5-methylcytosine-specific restriction enzyme A
MSRFVVGKEYRRGDIHDQYDAGSRQSGISVFKDHPIILLVTGPGGGKHGYDFDGFQPDGSFWYTGEGQVGDMEFVRGNRAVRDSAAAGKELHIFEQTRKAHIRYLGQASYLGHHHATSKDREGKERQAIVFELALEGDEADSAPASPNPVSDIDPELATKSLAELRAIALAKAPPTASKSEKRTITYRRSQAVKAYVLKRAGGVCESCALGAPFRTPKGDWYLEPHHIRRLADGGPDHPRWVAALCPNCHRRIHSGLDGKELNENLAGVIGAKEG